MHAFAARSSRHAVSGSACSLFALVALGCLLISSGPVYAQQALDEQKRLETIGHMTRGEQVLAIHQSFLQNYVRRAALLYLHRLDGLVCRDLFSLGDEALFAGAVGNTDGTEHNLVFIEGNVEPQHTDGGPYVLPASTYQKFWPPTSEMNTYWHEVNHALLEMANVTIDGAPYVNSMDPGGVPDTDNHHAFIEGVGQRGSEAYARLLPFEEAVFKADRDAAQYLANEGKPIDDFHERKFWTDAHTYFMAFLQGQRGSMAQIAKMPPEELARYRNATGVFFSTADQVAEFYRNGGLRSNQRGEMLPIRPPAWIFSPLPPGSLMPVHITLKDADHKDLDQPGAMAQAKFVVKNDAFCQEFRLWVSERGTAAQIGVGTSKITGKEVMRGRMRLALVENDSLVSLSLFRGGPSGSEIASSDKPSKHMFDNITLSDKFAFRVVFCRSKFSEMTQPATYHVNLFYSDADPNRRYHDTDTQLEFIVPATPKTVAVVPPKDLATGKGVPKKKYTFAADPHNIPQNAKYTWYLNGTQIAKGDKNKKPGITTAKGKGPKSYTVKVVAVWKVKNKQQQTDGSFTFTTTAPASTPPSPPPTTPPATTTPPVKPPIANPPAGSATTPSPPPTTPPATTTPPVKPPIANPPAVSTTVPLPPPTTTSPAKPLAAKEMKANLMDCLCEATEGGYKYTPDECAKAWPGSGGVCSTSGSLGGFFCRPLKPKTAEGAAACYESAYGKKAGSAELSQIEKDIRDANKKNMKPLKVTLAPDAKPIKAIYGTTVSLTANVEGGTPGYTYSWSGNGEGKDNTFTFINTRKPGSSSISVTVNDSDGSTATAGTTVVVEAITVRVEKTSPPTDTVTVGGKAQFKATVMSGTGQASGNFNFQWQPHPEIEFNPFEKSATTTATFRKPGTHNIYVHALVKDGAKYTTLGESNQVTITAVNPSWKMEFNPQEPLTGQEVRAKISPDAGADGSQPDMKEMNFRWQLPANAKQKGTSQDDREITFYLTDDKPANISCLASTKYDNTNLGGAGKTIKAKSYNLTINGPRPRQEFQVWKCETQLGGAPSCGMKKVENQYAVDQEILFSSKIEPAPEKPVSYNWTASPEGCTFNSNGGSATSITCRSTGGYALKVTAKTDGMEIGSATADVSVTISQDDIARSNKAKEAYEKLQKAKELVKQDKLDEGIQMAGEALSLDS
ncbi:MAG: PKD domain-containing protein, partial [Candidatus Omnitrophota bacterium]